jgi:orotate phosphoribosyltransferase
MTQPLTRAEVFVLYALEIGALELLPEGRKLKNGRISPYFFNSGLFNTGEAMNEIASAYAVAIEDGRIESYSVLYGPPYKGTILAPAVAMVLNDTFGYGAIRFCSSRKEEKGHGEGGVLIGSPIKKGDHVVIIDDVITDGGTKREAVELIRYYKGEVAGLVVAFDRQERGSGNLSAIQEFRREFDIPVYAVATLADLISVIKKTGCADDELLVKILDYQAEFGV